MKGILSIFAAICLCFVFTPNLTAQSTDAGTKLTVKVKGVGCNTDIKTIKANVEKLAGVTQCNVIKKGAITSFEVEYNAGEINRHKIYATIEDTPGCKNPADRPYKVKI